MILWVFYFFLTLIMWVFAGISGVVKWLRKREDYEMDMGNGV